MNGGVTSVSTPGTLEHAARPARRLTRRAALARIGAAGAVLAILPSLEIASASAQQVPCVGEGPSTPRRQVAPVALAAGLPEPFGYRPDETDRVAVLRDVEDIVRSQAAEVGAEACYLEKVLSIAQAISFLSPFEFLVTSLYESDPARRDALLDLYAADPAAAAREAAPLVTSPRAQMTMTTFGYYDVNSDRVLVNTAHLPPAELRRVLVHESWHAMPRIASWTNAQGTTCRTSGFWTQERHAGPRTWMPVEGRGDLPYEPYLLNEGMATLMETRYAGPSRFAARDVEQVRRFLEHLMEVSGPQAVMEPYLSSKPAGLVALVDQHRASLPELQPLAHP
jgi:hypothetical protein